ncbi:FKBP-type peptidyl-prolyl cis-trans isomerase [Kineococcus sp. SYSU DK006]|uniref:FKBP-type peptidyl-prolyl cis-trans isomerase n=1 Tax=Kineococcus sp. SYSU DK006 TaxID=3383127 RepID=UPI003D7C843A
MRRRTAVLSASAALAVSLVLGACASEQDTPSAAEQSASASASAATIEPAATDDALAVTVTGEVNPTVKPTVQVAAPLEVTETTRKVVAPGSGAEVAATDEVQFAYALYAGSTGEELDSSYGKTDSRFELANITKGLARGFVGSHVGDRLVIAIAPDDGFGEAVTQFGKEGVDAQTTIVVVADVVRIVPAMAEGTPVTPPADLPTVTTDEKGVPTGFTITDRTPPAQTVAQPLIQGTGPAVTSGQNLKVQYLGARLEDGSVFDQSWSRGEPFEFVIGQGNVIKGWDSGLVGQAVGSRVLLVIPGAEAYGDQPASPQQPAGTLVFVVDVLDAY